MAEAGRFFVGRNIDRWAIYGIKADGTTEIIVDYFRRRRHASEWLEDYRRAAAP